MKAVFHKNYRAHGSRGLAVRDLTKTNCTEDERFIFEFLELKREKQAMFKKDDDTESIDSVDDDEFESYLNGLGKKSKVDDEDDLDFLNDLGDELNDGGPKDKSKKKKKRNEDEEDDDDGDWDMDDNDNDDDGVSKAEPNDNAG